jgi:hypothetical protein
VTRVAYAVQSGRRFELLIEELIPPADQPFRIMTGREWWMIEGVEVSRDEWLAAYALETPVEE